MKFYKHFLKNPLCIRFLAGCAAFYMQFVYHTTRWQKIGWDSPQAYWQEGRPFICAFWHNRLFMGVFGWTHSTPFHMLISQHSDGQLIAKTVSHYGVKTISGSKSKGGLHAIRALLKILKEKGYIGITPDGPRGPRFQVSEGTITLARKTRCPILPFAYAIKRRKVLKSWDRFIVPLPFSRGVLAWGEPVFIPEEASEQETRRLKETITRQLLALTDRVDELCGHSPLR